MEFSVVVSMQMLEKYLGVVKILAYLTLSKASRTWISPPRNQVLRMNTSVFGVFGATVLPGFAGGDFVWPFLRAFF